MKDEKIIELINKSYFYDQSNLSIDSKYETNIIDIVTGYKNTYQYGGNHGGYQSMPPNLLLIEESFRAYGADENTRGYYGGILSLEESASGLLFVKQYGVGHYTSNSGLLRYPFNKDTFTGTLTSEEITNYKNCKNGQVEIIAKEGELTLYKMMTDNATPYFVYFYTINDDSLHIITDHNRYSYNPDENTYRRVSFSHRVGTTLYFSSMGVKYAHSKDGTPTLLEETSALFELAKPSIGFGYIPLKTKPNAFNELDEFTNATYKGFDYGVTKAYQFVKEVAILHEISSGILNTY